MHNQAVVLYITYSSFTITYHRTHTAILNSSTILLVVLYSYTTTIFKSSIKVKNKLQF